MNQGNQKRINEALSNFSSRVDTQKLLTMRVRKCIEVMEAICRKIIESLGNEQISMGLPDGIFSMRAGDRTISFAAAAGMASDARLRHPRGFYCCQILVLGHTEGQDESTLLTAFRVYADGTASDGELSWKCEEDSAEFESYLVGVICEHLLDSEFFWPSMSEMPESMRKVPIESNRVQTKQLEKTCIGFECALPSAKK